MAKVCHLAPREKRGLGTVRRSAALRCAASNVDICRTNGAGRLARVSFVSRDIAAASCECSHETCAVMR